MIALLIHPFVLGTATALGIAAWFERRHRTRLHGKAWSSAPCMLAVMGFIGAGVPMQKSGTSRAGQ